MDNRHIAGLKKAALSELIASADRVRARFIGRKIELCSIMNAKSGLCSQDCRFCAQAARHKTGAPVYRLKETKDIVDAAMRAENWGAERFGIVTSGETVCEKELSKICKAVARIRSKTKIKVCASLGRLDEKALCRLKNAGLSRYHHNIETSRSYFAKIVTTHTFQDRLKTIKAAKNAGLEVCSGGIIGMGERLDDRIEMALLLNQLSVDSVPINILVPIKGTPLEDKKPLSCSEAIRAIAIFRIILKDKTIKIAAGRESLLKDFQAAAFLAGANGMLIGGYLTTQGKPVADDLAFIKEVKRLWKG